MDCVNHSGANAAAYCQSCGKALCQACVRKGSSGQVFCEPCWMAWQSAQRPYVPPPAGGPSPGLAAVLGVIPGVGAMYNGQFVKGLVHVAIFAVLVSATHVFGVFGIFVMGWIFYQMFDAYHTARARRDGDPLPDPLGLNELSGWFVAGGQPPQGPPTGTAGAGQAANQGADQASYQAPFQAPFQGAFQAPFQSTYQGTVRATSAGADGAGYPADSTDPAHSADASGVLAAPGTGGRRHFDRPGRAVSAGTV